MDVKKKVVVLGCGRIGTTIARDLYPEFDVLVADINSDPLRIIKEGYGIPVEVCDFNDVDALSNLLSGFNFAVCAVPGFMGFETLKRIIEAGIDVVDISFFNENPFELDELAKEKGVTVIIDCGVAPGLSNIILGHHALISRLESFVCYVGGLPVERELPFEYKAPFSPIDVIAEYNRPARIIENGQLVIREALSEREILDFEGIGELEAFNTDGLRSIIHTMKVPNMKEKTLRYPGHAYIMEGFRTAGFFSEEEVEVKGKKLKPIDLTSKLLFECWDLKPNEKEFTVMRVELKDNMSTIRYTVLDKGDLENDMSSMARLTGFTCSAALRFLAKSNGIAKGILPPELLANTPRAFDFIMEYLKNKGVSIEVKTVVNN